ncbi:hypothetical protein PoB_005636500 [Plakobranchus ocellatus]|uniref:Uncharacterized protein n=1 Tax=Plakobranchus ocellatus TaxID=259542 RepID=A0AAV4CAU0_9GAST|nr:hypothetical protein PoB_005636500 [Plakobranchus ocellatus]
MGQFFSKKSNISGKRNGSTKSTETQMDSIQVKHVTLPGPALMSNVNLGLVNTVFEEKEKLINKYNLDIHAGDCQLILWENNKHTIMDDNSQIEVYKDQLISSRTRVELQHTASTTPNLGSLNVSLKNNIE